MTEEKETTEKETNKLNSRKFIVFVTGCIFCAAAMIYGFIVRDTELVKEGLDIFGFNAGFYVAGNSFSKWVNKKEEA